MSCWKSSIGAGDVVRREAVVDGDHRVRTGVVGKRRIGEEGGIVTCAARTVGPRDVAIGVGRCRERRSAGDQFVEVVAARSAAARVSASGIGSGVGSAWDPAERVDAVPQERIEVAFAERMADCRTRDRPPALRQRVRCRVEE